MKIKRLNRLFLLTLNVVLFSVSSYGQVTEKPVVHWKFNEATGTTTNDATGNTGTLTFVQEMDASAWVEGKYGTGLYFDGIDDKITGTYDSIYFDYESSSFSMSIWVNFSSDDINRKSRIITYGTFMLAQTVLADTGVMKLQVKNNSGSKLTLEVQDDIYFNDQWTLLTFVRDAENKMVKLYANAQLVGEKEYGDAFLNWDFNDSENLVTLGASTSTDPAKFQGGKGVMDDFRIYDVALTDTQIESLANCTADILAAYWALDEELGDVAADLSGNLNNATLYNMGDTNWVEAKLFNGLQFDGVDDYGKVEYNESLDFGNAPFSISLWVKTAENLTTNRYISYGSLIFRQNAGEVLFRINIDGAKFELKVPDTKIVINDWVLVTAVRDTTAGELQLYANTELLGTLEVPAGNFDKSDTDNSLYIGSNNEAKIAEGKHQGLKGYLDEIRIFNGKALSAEDILEIFSAGNTNYFDLTIEIPANGSIEVSPSGGTYPEGTPVQLTAIPVDGYHLDTWGGDATGTETVTTITMDSDKTVSATFLEGAVTYSITVSQEGDGTGIVARSTTETEIAQGTEVTLTAVAYEGSVFGGWSGDAEGFDATLVFTMEKDMNIIATFISDGPAYDVIATYQEMEATDTSGLNYTNEEPSTPIWTNNPGYFGEGFYDFVNVPGTYLEWTIKQEDIEGANNYYAIVRYAHGSEGDRPTKVELNGTVIKESHSFMPTGAWTIWKKEVFEVNLTDGDNTLKFTALADNGMVNLDQLEIARMGTGINDIDIEQLNVYPNPAIKNVNVDYQMVNNSVIKIQLFDLTGKSIETITNEYQTAGNYSINYNIEKLKTGIYFINITGKNTSKTVKFSVIN